MSAAHEETGRLGSEADVRGMFSDLEQITLNEARRTRTGVAVVCAAIVPGLGHLFTLRFGWALFYAVAAAALCYQATGILLDPDAWPWVAGAVLLWLANIWHAYDSGLRS